MTSGKPGQSLLLAFKPQDDAQLKQMLTQYPCQACGFTDGVCDEGPTLKSGFVVHHEVLKACPCGFASRFFVVLNDLRRQKSKLVTAADDALNRARENGLINDIELDEGINSLMLARHQNDLGRGTQLAEALALRYPQDPNLWFNLGYFYSESGRWQEAAACFQRTLEINPDIFDALFNEALMLVRLGRIPQAKECFKKIIANADKPLTQNDIWPIKSEADVSIEQGQLQVLSDPTTLRFLIDSRDYGDIFFSPSAALSYNQILGPGCYSSSTFINAWLIAASTAAKGRTLILDLGSGITTAVLLHHFPQMTIEVVETDTTLIQTVLQQLPILDHFISKGRLVIHNKNPMTFLQNTSSSFHLALIDLANQSEAAMERFQNQAFLPSLKKLSKSQFFNFFGICNQESLGACLYALSQQEINVDCLTNIISKDHWPRVPSHWLIGTNFPRIATLDALMAGLDRKEEAGNILYGQLDTLLTHLCDGSQVRQITANL